MENLWAKAVEKDSTVDDDGAPNHHRSKRVLLGEVQDDGMFRM